MSDTTYEEIVNSESYKEYVASQDNEYTASSENWEGNCWEPFV